jgi:O-antigen/teichoic acid export membrane protein
VPIDRSEVSHRWWKRHEPALWALASAVVGRLTGLLGALMAAAWLGAGMFGGVGSIVATVTMISSVAGLGLGQTVTTQLAARSYTDPVEGGYLAANVLVMAAIVGTVSGIALAVGAGTVAALGGFPEFAGHLRLAAPLVPLGVGAVAATAVLQGVQRYGSAARWLALRAILTGVAMGLGGVLGSLEATIVSLIIAESIAVLLVSLMVQREFHRLGIRLVPRNWPRTARLATSVGAPALVSVVATTLGLWTVRSVLLRQTGGVHEAGIFDAANRWAQFALFVPASLSTIQIPVLTHLRAQSRWADLRRQQGEWFWVGLVTTAVAGGALIISSRLLMGWVGPEFAGGATTLGVLALAAVPIGMNSLLGPVLIAAGQLWARCLADVALAMMLIGSAWVLVPVARSLGLAAAYLVSYSVLTLWLALRVRAVTSPPGLLDAAR